VPEQGFWAYAVTRARGAGGQLTGVAGEPVRFLPGEGLVAVVGAVGLDEFGEEGLRRNLEDLRWLERTARAHDAVVHAVARFGPVVPLRLATVYRDEDGIRAALAERRADFEAALSRVSGRSEWGVKAVVGAESPPPEEEQAPSGEVGEGTAYLSRRRARLSAREDAGRRAVEQADSVHRALAGVAVAARRNRARQSRVVLNGAYLVDDERVCEFRDVVRDLDAGHPAVELELSGPWPPYSFAGLEESR
jgi:hypothetical protein